MRLTKFLPFLFTILTAPVYADNVGDISGNYKCKGSDPFANINYEGTLVIHATGDTYSFSWDYGDNGKNVGTAIHNKENNSLAAIFWSDEDKKYVGVQSYQIKSDGSLDGSWTLKNAKKTGTETCEKVQ